MSAILLAGFAAPAFAQQSAPSADTAGQPEEIIVTGYRAALRNAISEKRDATVQVDAITAEDMADFPDTNLAESLQRLPGVSIDRDNGEGRTITVRGLGGDFNRTRLNGLEALATAGSNDSGTAPNRSRAFDYNTFASELFSSLKVQKSPDAQTDEGSLGATIDLQTGRPFDYKKTAFALSTEGSYQENSKKWSPRIAGLFSTRFFDDSMGILVSGAYSKSDNQIDQYRRQVGQPDYLYRSSDYVGNEAPQRAGFAAPTGTTFGSAITNPQVISALTGSNPAAYAKLYPGAPFNTPGRFDDSLVRIPALANIEQQDVKTERLGLTAAWQWQVGDRTRLSVDGAYSRFKNESTYNQLQTVGLNRNNTNATLNTASNTLAVSTARGLYPGLCVPSAGSNLVPAQDCGQQLYGTTPVFGTALSSTNASVASVLGTAAVVPGGASAANANTFSVNPFNLDPYDYYNNPASVGYIASTNHIAFRSALIGRPAVKVLDANVTNGVADYLVLSGVDWRSAQDQNSYITQFKQLSYQLDHEFSDRFKAQMIAGFSESTNRATGILVELNRMDSPESFTFDERGGAGMPVFNLGFDAANPANWQIVKGFSAIRHFKRNVTNKYRQARVDFDWQVNDEFSVGFGANYRKYSFNTTYFERNNDLLNPTLREANVPTSSVTKLIQFGQGLNVPQGTLSSFVVPDIEAYKKLFDFTCNCVNKWGDWRLTDRRAGGPQNFDVSEIDKGVYLQVDWNTEILGRPFRGNAGTRIAITDIDASGTSTSGRIITGTNHYTDYLPSFNLVYEPIDKVLLRFGMSKAMSRPLLVNLAPTVSAFSIPTTPGATSGATLTVGNPRLNPYRSSNLDASVEWYFAKGGLLSLAYFSKSISSFPQTVLFDTKLSEILDPDAIEALKAQLTDPNQLAYITADSPFTARQFRDAPGGYVRGFEASFQMDFTFLPGFFKNFGVQLNYTKIASSLQYIVDPGARVNGVQTRAPTFGTAPFLNVSPQAFNATLYYETKKFRARTSIAQRKGYATTYPISAGTCGPGIIAPVSADPNVVAANNTNGGACQAPLVNDFIFSKSTFNVDASASFQITDFATITLEGLNLTNQKNERYAYQAQPVISNYASTGRILRVGARFKF